MRERCPTARFHGIARLRDHGFRIVRSGYASLAWERGATVYGVLWSVAPRDERYLDAYEDIAAGLYRRACRTVEASSDAARIVALTYLARDGALGRPRRFYVETIVQAAQSHGLPPAAVADIARWLPDANGAASGR